MDIDLLVGIFIASCVSWGFFGGYILWPRQFWLVGEIVERLRWNNISVYIENLLCLLFYLIILNCIMITLCIFPLLVKKSGEMVNIFFLWKDLSSLTLGSSLFGYAYYGIRKKSSS